MFQYYDGMWLHSNVSPVDCIKNINETGSASCGTGNRPDLKALSDIASGLETKACFCYSLGFLLLPLVFYCYEWYKTKYNSFVNKVCLLHTIFTISLLSITKNETIIKTF